MKHKINKFYVVTNSSSLYKAVIGGKGNVPSLVKLKLNGQSEAPAGTVFSDGTMLAIGKYLILFVPEGGGLSSIERQISMVNTRYWGSNTSMVVALFKTEKEADFCLENHTKKNNQKYQDQWKQSTIEVLQAIGNDHPYCSIETSSSDLWLMDPKEWIK